MVYSREVTHKIVECWGLGLTAEETVKAIEEWKGIHIGLATVYRHRHSLTAEQIIDELIRKQLRDIAKADDQELKLRYRQELLKILMPQRIEALTMSVVKQQTTQKIDLSQYSEEDKIAILDAYRRINRKTSGTAKSNRIH